MTLQKRLCDKFDGRRI